MAQQPMRSEEELRLRDKRVVVSISKMRINLDEIHAESLFNLTLDILKQHSLFNALTLTTDALEIYIQQFWHTVNQNENTKRYYFHLDYQQFEVGADLLRHALKTSPKQPNQPFVETPSQDELVTSIMKLGYVDTLTANSEVVVNKLHQAWRTFLSIINKCLTGKSLGANRAREPIVQIL
ncbi:hypothetical protein Tco_0240923 [Tanacetum coccineum]